MPLTQITAFHRPPDLDAAWQLVRDGGEAVRLLAGATDLAANCPRGVHELVDLSGLGLRTIEVADDGSIHLGAMVTFTDMLEHPALAAHGSGVLPEMLVQIGSMLHRNSATVGGHVARGRLSDVIPVLLALDASVVCYAGAEHTMSLRAYYADRPAAHVVTEVVLPSLPPPSAAAFVRFTRAGFDHAIVNAACRVDVDDGTVRAARVVVGQTAVLGHHVDAAEQALAGRPFTAEAIAAAAAATRGSVDTRGDWVASPEFRRHLTGVAVQRCLDKIAERLDGGSA